MTSIDHPEPGVASVPLQDRFEVLRAAYYARLHRERLQIIELRTRLIRRKSDPVPMIYDDIRRIAHSMAGAAAVFEAPLVAQSAHALEDAATASARAPDTADDAALRTALNALICAALTAGEAVRVPGPPTGFRLKATAPPKPCVVPRAQVRTRSATTKLAPDRSLRFSSLCSASAGCATREGGQRVISSPIRRPKSPKARWGRSIDGPKALLPCVSQYRRCDDCPDAQWCTWRKLLAEE